MNKKLITSIAIASILMTSSVKADIINGVHVIRKADTSGKLSEREAISDSGINYSNDNNIWYAEDGSNKGIIEPDKQEIETPETTLPEQQTPEKLPTIDTTTSTTEEKPKPDTKQTETKPTESTTAPSKTTESMPHEVVTPTINWHSEDDKELQELKKQEEDYVNSLPDLSEEQQKAQDTKTTVEQPKAELQITESEQQKQVSKTDKMNTLPKTGDSKLDFVLTSIGIVLVIFSLLLVLKTKLKRGKL